MSNEILDQQSYLSKNLEIKANVIKYGMIGGLGGVIVSLILFFTDMQMETWSKWLPTAVMVIAIIVGIRTIARENPNVLISFGSLFKAGILITLIITVISDIYFLIYVNVIDPDFIDKILDVSRQQMAEKGLSEEQIDNALKITRKFMSPGIMVFFSFVSSLIFGAITSAISAAIFKKEK